MTPAMEPETSYSSAAYSGDNGQRIYNPRDNDVLLGKVSHPGNEKLHQFVRGFAQRYYDPSSNLAYKKAIREEVHTMVSSETPPGRFLTRPGLANYWLEASDEMIYKKLTGAFSSVKKKLIKEKGETPERNNRQQRLQTNTPGSTRATTHSNSRRGSSSNRAVESNTNLARGRSNSEPNIVSQRNQHRSTNRATGGQLASATNHGGSNKSSSQSVARRPVTRSSPGKSPPSPSAPSNNKRKSSSSPSSASAKKPKKASKSDKKKSRKSTDSGQNQANGSIAVDNYEEDGLLFSERLSDVTIRCGVRLTADVCGHKAILANASSKLGSIMENMANNSNAVLEIAYPVRIVREMLRFIYQKNGSTASAKRASSPLDETSELIKKDARLLFDISKDYQLTDFHQFIFRAVYKTISVKTLKPNLLGRLKAKDSGLDDAIIQVCLAFIRNNAREVFKDKEFLSLSKINPNLWDRIVDAAFEDDSSSTSSSSSSSSDDESSVEVVRVTGAKKR